MPNFPSKLKHLCFKSICFSEIPIAINEISELLVLEFVNCHGISKLPKELSRLKKLESLTLHFTNVEKIDALATIKTLKYLKINRSTSPAINLNHISQLKNLEQLDVSDNLYLKDMGPLKNLSNLKKLNLKSTSVRNLRALKNMLFLNDLNLKSCDHIDSLEPIMHLPLQVLNIKDAEVEVLDSIIKHPTLKNLIADAELMLLFEKRAEIEIIENTETIKTLLKSHLLEDVEKGLHQFAMYVTLNSTNKIKTICSFFDIDMSNFDSEAEEDIELSDLTEILNVFQNQLSIPSFINIIQPTLVWDNSFTVTFEAIDILIKRYGELGKKAINEVFKLTGISIDY